MLNYLTNFTYKIERQAARLGLVYRLALRYYRQVIEKEAVLANITAQDHILCVGGGICPFSAVLFHEITGAKVTVIDNNALCVPKARQVIERLGVGSHVRVFYEDGGSIADFSEYSVIHLALQVSPLERVFACAKKAALPGARLLIRKLHRGGSYPPELTRCPYTAHKSRNIGSTLLYIKQDAAA